MTGIELVAGYLAAWSVRKLRRVGTVMDNEADRVIDAALEKVHDVVNGKLDGDPALAKLKAAPGAVSERVARRVEDAVADAADEDPEFAAALAAAVAAVRAAEEANGIAAAGAATIVVSGKGAVGVQTISGGAIVQTGRGSHVRR